MIRDYEKTLNRIHIVMDMIAIAAAYSLAWLLVVTSAAEGVLPPSVYFSALIYIEPGFMLLNALNSMYAEKRNGGRRRDFMNILRASSIGILVFAAVLYLGSKNYVMYHFSRRLVAYFYVLVVVIEFLERSALRVALRKLSKSSFVVRRQMLLVGYSSAAEGYIDRILRSPEWGYVIKGILDDNKPAGYEYKGVKVIGTTGELAGLLDDESSDIEEIAITLRLDDYDDLGEIVNVCERSGVHTKFVPDYYKIIPTTPYLEDAAGLPIINIRRVPVIEFPNNVIKRAMDIAAGITGLVLFSPIMLVTIIAIKLEELRLPREQRGPLFFAQERVGLHNKTFKMYKFRSMRMQTEEEEKKSWTTDHDPRVTKVGKIIRRTSIDEMPQFWNILRGDMSLVGPRPERPQFVARFRDEIPHYMIKHQVRPGLTGWAQVNGLRGDTSIEKRIEYDLYYIENWTVGFDIKIILMTIFKGFINKNAY